MTKTKPCAECKEEFEFKTHNQKYCSNHCCRIATNKRIMQKYYEKKERLSGKERRCVGCNAVLSKYNDSEICAKCSAENVRLRTKTVIGDIKDVIGTIEKNKSKKSSRN